MMYYYWVKGRIRPSVFYNMDIGERLVIRAFYEEELKDREKFIKESAIFPVQII